MFEFLKKWTFLNINKTVFTINLRVIKKKNNFFGEFYTIVLNFLSFGSDQFFYNFGKM